MAVWLSRLRLMIDSMPARELCTDMPKAVGESGSSRARLSRRPSICVTLPLRELKITRGLKSGLMSIATRSAILPSLGSRRRSPAGRSRTSGAPSAFGVSASPSAQASQAAGPSNPGAQAYQLRTVKEQVTSPVMASGGERRLVQFLVDIMFERPDPLAVVAVDLSVVIEQVLAADIFDRIGRLGIADVDDGDVAAAALRCLHQARAHLFNRPAAVDGGGPDRRSDTVERAVLQLHRDCRRIDVINGLHAPETAADEQGHGDNHRQIEKFLHDIISLNHVPDPVLGRASLRAETYLSFGGMASGKTREAPSAPGIFCGDRSGAFCAFLSYRGWHLPRFLFMICQNNNRESGMSLIGKIEQSHKTMVEGRDIPWLLRQWAERCPDKPFLIWEPFDRPSVRYSYAEFAAHVERLAGALHTRGVVKGDKVMVHLDNSPEFLFGWFACARLGAVAVSTNTRSVARDMIYFAEHAEIVAAITQPAFAKLVYESAPKIKFLVLADNDAGEPAEIPAGIPHVPF